MAKTQPKIDDIKDLKKVTTTSDGLMSKEDKIKLDNLDYGDLGDMPVATDTKVGGIKIGYTPDAGSPGNLPVRLGINDNLNKAFVVMTSRNIKQTLGINNSTEFNGDDIFTSGISTTNYSNDFNEILYIGSYRVYGSYSNAPDSVCGTNTGTTASMVGSLNVFRSGVNNWETIQQLFWVQSGVVEQYQRSYYKNGSNMTWSVWKRLIKCDDYATLGRGGIISEANFGELFRAPDLIQLWNEDELSLAGGVYYLDSLSIGTPIVNSIHIDSGNVKDIVGLTSERRYRVTYEVHCKINRGDKEGAGEVTIKIKNGNEELYSATEYISDSEIRKSITFSVIITGTEVITPSIEVGSELTITIPIHYYQVSIEEIKFPYFTSVQ